MLKFGHAAIVTPIVDQGKWVDKKTEPGRIVVAKQVVAKYNPSQWLLTHCTIIASVDVDQADPKDKKSNYLIKPEYSIFVNNNGDSWERNLLKSCYKTFLGADSYVEHVQIPELSKGKVIDVAMREVPFCKDNGGKDLTTLYVDILVANDRKHTDLVEKIISGEYGNLSMGCLIKASRCSQCGQFAEDEAHACKHVRFFKNNYYYDKNGIKRIVAELCGVEGDPESCKFIDASWVRKPAFLGAVLRNIVEPSDDVSEKIRSAVAFPSFKAEKGMNLRAASLAAKQLVNEVEAQDAAPAAPPAADPAADPAAAPAAPPPADDSRFPSAPPAGAAPLTPDPTGAPPADPLAAGAPPADPLAAGGLGAPPAPGMPPAPGAPPMPGTPPPPDPGTELTNEVTKLVKEQALKWIRDKLQGPSAPAKSTPASERPQTGPDNEGNASIIKNATAKLLQSSLKVGNDRLYNGLMLLSNLKDWKSFRKYGYNRNDVLGILYYIDRETNKQPASMDAVKMLSRVKTAGSDLEGFFRELILETGAKPSTGEARKLAKWAKILKNFD